MTAIVDLRGWLPAKASELEGVEVGRTFSFLTSTVWLVDTSKDEFRVNGGVGSNMPLVSRAESIKVVGSSSKRPSCLAMSTWAEFLITSEMVSDMTDDSCVAFVSFESVWSAILAGREYNNSRPAYKFVSFKT